jgi:pyruvate-formate lyase-activating enzyme
MVDKQRIDRLRPVMDAISPTFCMAKWHHTTIYLHTGETHSCYHPPPHRISREEIKTNPGALHNTAIKRQERQQMMDGERPEGCQYCWNIEDLGPDYVSDRHIRSSSIYRPDRYQSIKRQGAWLDVKPEYIEVSFGNECNFKCGYCHPKASSKYHNEIRDHGPFTMVTNHRCDIDYFDIYEEDKNPYVDAWWRWWPDLRDSVNILRVTGGEPLLHRSTWRLLDDLQANPMPGLELNINSNLGVKPLLVERLATKIRALMDAGCIKDFQLFTSIDTWGEQAEYGRTGLDLAIWEKNLDTYLRIAKLPVSLMITYNVLSVPRFKLLLEKILEWRARYAEFNSNKSMRNVRFDTPYLKEPLQYDINILPKQQFLPYMQDSLAFMESRCDDQDKLLFGSLEVDKFKRVVKYMENTLYDTEKLSVGRKDFHNWFKELDRRRQTDFRATFPELTEFYDSCSVRLTRILDLP